MTIKDIYEKYNIIPNLREHQLRVAAVAWFLCDHATEESVSLEKNEIITACLLHDMGNIIKFDFENSPISIENLEYWKAEQGKWREKYGEEHAATYVIAEELGVSDRIEELIRAVGFSRHCKNASHGDMAKKICTYADMRVAPTGIVSIEERIKDMQERYANRVKSEEDRRKRESLENCLRRIENQIFERMDTGPEKIMDASVSVYLEKVSEFETK